MKKILITAAAVLALAAPVSATSINDWAMGEGVGFVNSNSVTGGLAVTGGVAGQGNSGFSSVENFQGASNFSGVEGTLNFDPRYGMGDPRDGITVEMSFETISVSEQLSQTRVRDRGVGTAGFGGGFAASGGEAHGSGWTAFGGFDDW